jgi:zinc transport system ATP-binding protein
MTDPLILCDHVSWRANGLSILQQVSFSISPGEIVTIIGPNGAGKTSLVNLVIGLTSPTQGKIIRQPKLRLGYMPQHLRFDDQLPLQVDEFLRLASRDTQAIARYTDRLGIHGLLRTSLHNLSGGELQRVLLTRAVLRQPELLVLDEPTQGVDLVGQSDVYRHIAELRDELGCGVLMVSHDLHLVMAKTDTVICLNHHICCQGAPENVAIHPEYLQLFGSQAQDIAVYTHHHDHTHDLHGDILHSHSHCDHPDHHHP